MKTVALVGNPNVGKSVLFYHLTGNYVTVSNYPGTTVELSQGVANLYGKSYLVYDTPGMYSLSSVTEEEAVTRRFLMEKSPDLVIHVVDTKNLPRMLPLTLELLSCGFPVLLALNMMDEADKLGVRVNRVKLAEHLGIGVVEAAFAHGRGVPTLKREMVRVMATEATGSTLPAVPHRVKRAAACFTGQYPLPNPVIAPLPLEEDEKGSLFHFALQRRVEAEIMLTSIFRAGTEGGRGWLDRVTLNPWGGFLITLAVLYFGLYLFVGSFGAGILVDLLEGTLFGEIIIPQVSHWVDVLIPYAALQELLAGEFGILTLGFRYAVGIILPIVGTFFFFFSLLEDIGYLPRLAYWADGWMSKNGLNGRAVIPLTLGLGCGTMAVLVTRTLESRRERMIATFLLALAIPCSAQLGLILALMSKEPTYLLIWGSVVGGVFLFAGHVLNVLLPGSRAPFFMELPPLRMPKLNAILQKTLARMRWYFLEIIPVFMLVSLSLWALQTVGLLDNLAGSLSPLLGRIGLPPQLSLVFLYGFFRRDYGAAGLFDLFIAGSVSSAQLLVAAVVLTLFLPCLAQMSMMIRERGLIASTVIIFTVTGDRKSTR